MKFNIEGDIIATTSHHERLIRLYIVPEGLNICSLQPTQTSKVLSTILDMSFCVQTNYFCCLIQVSKPKSEPYSDDALDYDLYVEVFDLEESLVNFKRKHRIGTG